MEGAGDLARVGPALDRAGGLGRLGSSLEGVGSSDWSEKVGVCLSGADCLFRLGAGLTPNVGTILSPGLVGAGGQGTGFLLRKMGRILLTPGAVVQAGCRGGSCASNGDAGRPGTGMLLAKTESGEGLVWTLSRPFPDPNKIFLW